MRNDQIFVLLLVVLLPMSGCFDGAVGDAEATDDETSSVEHIEPLYSISIDDGDSHTIILNGTSLKIDSAFYRAENDWRSMGSLFKVSYSITCDDGFVIEKLYAFSGDTLPVMGGVECSVDIVANDDIVMIFREVQIEALR
jgi:hypothetical protein